MHHGIALKLFSANLFAIALTACASSVTYIESGQTFVLGGNQSLPLRVEGRNIGAVPVEVLVRKDGQTNLAATVPSGHLFSRTFAAGETALIRNTSPNKQAQVGLELSPQIKQMSMGYEATDKASTK